MRGLVIKGGTCITPELEIEDGVVVTRGEKIVSVGAAKNEINSDETVTIDASGLYVCPGFIDVQINGASGFDVLDASEEALREIARFFLSHGTTSFLPTLVSSPNVKMRSVFQHVRNLMGNIQQGAKILGLHLEGPYISKAQIGAHDPRFVRIPTEEEARFLLDNADLIRVITAAPEIVGVRDLIEQITRNGVVASVGHSNATYDEVLAAVKSGFSMVTHIYSVMSSMSRDGLRKIAGVLESALLLDSLKVELVGDGLHVPEPFFRLVVKAKGTDDVFLATDAIRATGLPDGKYILGGEEEGNAILVENGIAMTADRKLYAGSTCTMTVCVRNAMRLGGVALKDAVAMASINPARLLHLDSEIGSLEPGKKADIVILDRDFNTIFTIIDGEVRFQTQRSS